MAKGNFFYDRFMPISNAFQVCLIQWGILYILDGQTRRGILDIGVGALFLSVGYFLYARMATVPAIAQKRLLLASSGFSLGILGIDLLAHPKVGWWQHVPPTSTWTGIVLLLGGVAFALLAMFSSFEPPPAQPKKMVWY